MDSVRVLADRLRGRGYTAAGSRRTSNAAAGPRVHRHIEHRAKVQTNAIGWPGALHVRGSVVPRIALPVVIFTLWALLIWVLANFAAATPGDLAFPPMFITVISLVLSLLLVFRTNSSYDRWNEGRKLWGTLTVASRNLTRLIWVSVDEKDARDTREKLAALNLVLAFSVATRNHLRGEYGLVDAHGQERAELARLIPRNRRGDVAARGHVEGLRARTASANADHVAVGVGAEGLVPTNIPVDVSHLLAAYLLAQRKKERIDIPQFGAATTIISSLVDTVSNLERILTSPIPVAYSVHLTQSLYVYLLLLPFQLIATFRAWTILVVALASFTLLGVNAIGLEIEQPFGYDRNDLPLDTFVDTLRAEIMAVVQSEPISLAEWDLNLVAAEGTVAEGPASSATLATPQGSLGRAFNRTGASAYDRLVQRAGGSAPPAAAGVNSPMQSLRGLFKSG